MTLRVLLVEDRAASPSQLEEDPLPDGLAGLDGVDLRVVRLAEQATVPGSAPDDDEDGEAGADATPVQAPADLPGLGAEVWVTTSAAALTRVGRTARAHGVRVVHQVRRLVGDDSTRLERQFGLLGLADAVVVPSLAAAEWLRTAAGDSAPDVVVVRPWLAGGPRPRADVAGSRLLVSPGPLVVERRAGRAVAAFGRVADRLPDWRMRLLGGGPLVGEMRAQGRRERLGDRLVVTGPDPDVRAEWAQAGIAVLTPRVEPSAADGLAAMAAGVPVIATDVPGAMRELVRHRRNGLLVSPSSVQDLAVAMLTLAGDDALRIELGEAARATATEKTADDALRRWSAVLHGDPTPDDAPPPSGAAPAVPVATPDVTLAAAAAARGVRPAADEPTPAQARAAAVRLLRDAAGAAGVDWCVIDRPRPVVVVPDDAREPLLRAIAASGAPSWLSLRVPTHASWPERRLALADAEQAVQGLSPVLEVEPWPLDARGTARLAGQGCAVEVQLWARGFDGTLLPPSPNGLMDSVPLPLPTRPGRVHDVDVPVLAGSGAPCVHDRAFDVDVVVTWVDGADPAWRARRDARLAETGGAALAETASGRARYTDHGELRYCLRSVHCFAPWVRRIHLVTAGQVPAWLDSSDPRVVVVDHTEILPADALPTFSSRAIETALHRIDGLAEHFVYLNDDVLLGRPLGVEHFFTAAGAPSVFLAQQPIGVPRPDRPAYLAAAANNRRLLLEAFGVEISQTLAHTAHPHRRSLLAEVAERFADEVDATARRPFRSDEDVSMMSSLAQHYGLITGRAVPAEPDLAFVGLGAPDLRRQVRVASKRQQDFLCLADQHDYALPPAKVDGLLQSLLGTYLPVPAPWETDQG